MLLYRGTPEPEDFPSVREHPCIFFASDAYAAANYGDYVQAYEVGKPKLFRYDTSESQEIVGEFLGIDPSDPAYYAKAMNLAIHPTDEWIGYLHDDLEFDGYRYNKEILCLFEPYVVKLPVRVVGREVIQAR